jgi:hypothetical protein
MPHIRLRANWERWTSAKSILPAWISLREAGEDMYGPRFETNGAIGFSTSSASDAPEKSAIRVSGAWAARCVARAGRKTFGSPALVNPLMATTDRLVTCVTASSTGTTLASSSWLSMRSVRADIGG